MIGKTTFYLIIVIGIAVALVLLSQLMESSWWVLKNKNPAELIKESLNLTDNKMDGEIIIGQNSWRFDLAETATARAKGLSGRESLSSKEGMLFVFNKLAIHSFWMKGMLFPLDFVWIKSTEEGRGVVVGTTENVPPLNLQNIKFYSPPEPVDLILEIRAGLVMERGVRKGDVVRINFSD